MVAAEKLTLALTLTDWWRQSGLKSPMAAVGATVTGAGGYERLWGVGADRGTALHGRGMVVGWSCMGAKVAGTEPTRRAKGRVKGRVKGRPKGEDQ